MRPSAFCQFVHRVPSDWCLLGDNYVRASCQKEDNDKNNYNRLKVCVYDLKLSHQSTCHCYIALCYREHMLGNMYVIFNVTDAIYFILGNSLVRQGLLPNYLAYGLSNLSLEGFSTIIIRSYINVKGSIWLDWSLRNGQDHRITIRQRQVTFGLCRSINRINQNLYTETNKIHDVFSKDLANLIAEVAALK